MSDIVTRLRDKHCCDDACHCDEAAAEIERLRAACHAIAETLAAKEAETRRLHVALETANANCDRMAALAIDNAKDTERLRAALELWHLAVRIDATMEGPVYMGVSSTLGRKAWEQTRAALANDVRITAQPAEGEKHE